MFALEITPPDAATKIMLNPGAFVIPNVDTYKVHGFCFAPDADEAHMLDCTGSSAASLNLITSLKANRLIVPKGGEGGVRSRAAPSQRLAKPDDDLNASELASEIIRKQQNGDGGMEDTRLYHVLKQPARLEDATINVSLEKDFPHVKNHAIVCGEISTIYQFVRTLRVKNMGPYRPVVILFPSMPRPIWNKIRHFPQIYFCDGSPLESSDLIRAGILRASKAIVLATVDEKNNENQDDEALVDAASLFASHSISRVRSDINIVTEILLRNNIPFVNPSDMTLLEVVKMGRVQSIPFHVTPSFASGNVFTSSMLDTLVCQSYYNPNLVEVIRLLVEGGGDFDAAWLQKISQYGELKKMYVYQVRAQWSCSSPPIS